MVGFMGIRTYFPEKFSDMCFKRLCSPVDAASWIYARCFDLSLCRIADFEIVVWRPLHNAQDYLTLRGCYGPKQNLVKQC